VLSRICRAAAYRESGPVAEAVAFLGVLGSREDVPRLVAALGRNETAVAALRALGALGSVEAIPALIAAMEDEALAAEACAAFRRISGAEGIEREATPPLTPGEADLLDALSLREPDQEPGAEFDPSTGPPGDPDRARAWWKLHEREFDPQGRWQVGRECSAGPGVSFFDELPLQIRRDLFLSACARGAAVSDLELEARASLQLGRASQGGRC
jgi:hypothetical protein